MDARLRRLIVLAGVIVVFMVMWTIFLSAKPWRTPCELVRVTDGRTVVVKVAQDGEASIYMLRLLRVAPPSGDADGVREARAALERLLAGRQLEIEYENPGQPLPDHEGRFPAYVLADGELVNVELVRAGWARFNARRGRGRYGDTFERAEADAREAGRGLWARPEAE